ncbi:MAG: hypothetical protein QOE70_2474 [Chthoniobacter sp.]|jgi:autotransporter-associated beta strand protein|nr:hypothetical protein [Chthoniobacter sp.]
MTWNSAGWNTTSGPPSYVVGGFVPTGSNLILGAADADGTVDFQNPIRLLGSSGNLILVPRTIQVENGSAAIDAKISGVISNEAGLTKSGAGTLELTAVNTYTGPTVVSAGRLLVSGSLTGTGAVAVQSGGILGGSGAINGALSVNIGGALAPGSGNTGALDVNAALGLGAGSTLAIEITGTAPGDGAGFYDQANMTVAGGSISLDGTAQITLSLSGFTPADTDKFFVLTRADGGAFSTTFANAGEGATVNLAGGFTGQITYGANWTGVQATSTLMGGNDVAIYNVVAVVPEPGTPVTLLGGIGVLLGLRRRQRKA